MPPRFARRTQAARRSFIREILKVTADPAIISFAGGLPNPRSFPVEEIAASAAAVLADEGTDALQYTLTEGYPPLREFIAKRYRDKFSFDVSPEEILITTGSQQAIDLIGKAFLDPGDTVLMERPGYLGTIQSLSLYEPVFRSVPMRDDGIDADALENAIVETKAKIFYAVPSFQNPSGITYSRERRAAVAGILAKHDTVLVEDNPYGELRFRGESLPPVRAFTGGRSILTGSFSKTVAPGLRLGWVCAPKDIMERLIIAKQAADLHTDHLSQRIVHHHLTHHDLESHLERIRSMYGRQRDLMVEMIERHFPPGVRFTRPEGGMFLWITLPDGCSVMKLFERAVQEKVAFVPGSAFYCDVQDDSSFRLNFSNSDEARIEEGVARLGRVLKGFLGA